MTAINQFNIRSYQYKDFPELVHALFTVKKATLKDSLNLGRFDGEDLKTLILACEKSLES